MEEKKGMLPKGISAIVVATIAAVAAIICMTILTNGVVSYKTHSGGDGLTATGSASCNFESDLIVWRGSFSAYGMTTKEAYGVIKDNAEIVKQYLLDNGITESELVFSSIDISQRYRTEYDEEGNYKREYPDGYDLYQGLTVTSTDIDKVEYYCTKLDEVKLDLIEKATDNARQRIDILVEGTGSRRGKLLTASLGVFQITPTNSGSSSYSYDGAFDTKSRYKTATVTVRLNYAAE